jgi:hypothetical protein
LNQQFRYRPFSASNPLANAFVVIVGIIVISAFLALGFVVFLGIVGFMLVMATIVGVRAWWRKKRFGAQKGSGKVRDPGKPETRRVIEGEFHEVEPRDADRDSR